MISIDPKDLSSKENYKLLIGGVIPRPIAFVTTYSKEHIINGAPFSFFNVVSSSPPLLSISIQRKNGEHKDTAKNIFENKEFVVQTVEETNIEKINQAAAPLPFNESEISLANLTPTDSKIVHVPGIKESKIRYECRLEQHLEIKDDEKAVCDLILGRIVHYHIDDSIYHEGKINYEQLNPISRLAGDDYAKLGPIFSIPRPR